MESKVGPCSRWRSLLVLVAVWSVAVTTVGLTSAPARAEGHLVTWTTTRTLLSNGEPSVDLTVTCLEDVDSMALYDTATGRMLPAHGYSSCRAGQTVVVARDYRYSLPGGERALHVQSRAGGQGEHQRISEDITISREPFDVTGYVHRDSNWFGGRAVVDFSGASLDGEIGLDLHLMRETAGDGDLRYISRCWWGTECSMDLQWSSAVSGQDFWYYQWTWGGEHTEPVRLPVLEYADPGTVMASGKNPDGLGCQGCMADPVNTYTGVYFDSWTDLTISGRGPALGFTRYYSTGDLSDGAGLGHGWRHSYAWELDHDEAAGTVEVIDERGNIVTFTDDGTGSWGGPGFVDQELTQSPEGWTLKRPRAGTSYEFDPLGQLTAVVDGNDERLVLTREAGRLVRIEGQAGRSITLGWAGDRISSLTDHTGRAVELDHDPSGSLVAVTGSEAGSWTHAYDEARRMLSKTDALGGVVSNVYDTRGRVTRQTDPTGAVTTFGYQGHANGALVTTTTLPDRTQVVDTYADGVLLGRSRTNRAGTTWAYDPATLAPIRVQTGDRVTTHEVDDKGQPTRTVDPVGGVTETTWTAHGQPQTLIDPAGGVTSFAYDSRHNLTSFTTPAPAGPATTTWVYADPDHPGDLTSVIDAAGNSSEFVRDPAGDVVSTTDRTGRSTTIVRDRLGRPVTTTAGDGSRQKTTYDAAHRPLASTTAAGTTSLDYDAAGRPTTVTDPGGVSTELTYDLAGRVTSVTTGDATTLTSYDTAGRILSRVDGAGNATTYGYGYSGIEPTTITDPLGNTTSFRWDRYGQLEGETRPGYRTITWRYDDAGRPVSRTTLGNSPYTLTSWTYDALGRRTSMTGADGSTTYTYDAASNLAAVDTPGDLNDTAYSYDILGRQTSLTHAAGSVHRSFDEEGRLTGLVDIDGSTHSWDYDAAGLLNTHVRPGGITTTSTRDGAARLTNQATTGAAGLVSGLDLTWDASSRLDRIGLAGAGLLGQAVRDLMHDPAGRIIDDHTGRYSWDAAGNMTAMPGQSSRTFDAAGRLLEVTSDEGPVTLDWSPAGSLTSRTDSNGTTSYGYDGLERMTSHTATDGTETAYNYNGDGVRISRTIGTGPTEEFGWDVSGPLETLLIDGTHAYTHGPTGLLAAHDLDTGQALYPVTDQVGSVRAWADDTGAVAGRADYTTFGERTTDGVVLPFGFAGEYHDEPSGLLHLRARYYDPELAIFTTLDPLVEATRDPYGYAAGNPTLLTDPGGEVAWVAPALVGAAFGGVTSAASYTIDARRDGTFQVNTLLAKTATGAFVGGAESVLPWERLRLADRLIGGAVTGLVSAAVQGLATLDPPDLRDFAIASLAGTGGAAASGAFIRSTKALGAPVDGTTQVADALGGGLSSLTTSTLASGIWGAC